MRKFVARISNEFLEKHPKDNSTFPQPYAYRVPMPIVKYPRGIPEPGETCFVLITKEDRWFYNRFHAAREEAKKIDPSNPPKIDPFNLPKPEKIYGEKMVIRIYRLDPPSQKPAKFELTCWYSPGKRTRMKFVPHENPPPIMEEIAGGINSSPGTHWVRIAILLKTLPDLTEDQEREIDEILFQKANENG